ncbi:unnamed protein product [Dicrocoelium dendriticum]|nr:unnamed protein product [Dicrocoelium dendriticum]
MLPDPCPLSPTQSGCKSFISVRPKSTASSTCGKKITQLGADGMRLPRYHSKTYATNYYNTARQMIYPRYTEEAWTLATKTAEANSGQERAEAEEFRYATWRTMAEIERKAKERQKLSTMKLKNRIDAINYWINELASEISLMDEEQDKCKDRLRHLELMREHIRKSMEIGEQCLSNRENRRGIDEVKDCAERALNKEAKTIEQCLAQIDQILHAGAVQQK